MGGKTCICCLSVILSGRLSFLDDDEGIVADALVPSFRVCYLEFDEERRIETRL